MLARGFGREWGRMAGDDEGTGRISELVPGSKQLWFDQDGGREKASYTFYRGEQTTFYPKDESLDGERFIELHIARGLMPPAPLIDASSTVVAFGSCFAAHISRYLDQRGFNVATSKPSLAYISKMGDGIVNTYALRQQFAWAWRGEQPQVELWHGYDGKALGYDEAVREETRRLLDQADAFVITLGLSEVWYDEPTGEVFWRAVPLQHFDPARHKFRMTTHKENLQNLRAIYRLIRKHRPGAAIVFTLSPICMTATFRDIACMTADSASKAVLRAALDEFLREAQPDDDRLIYFPSYEVVTRCFDHPYMEDRRHVHKHVLDFNMTLFERYCCGTGLDDAALLDAFRTARALDRTVVQEGHFAVPRINARHHLPRGDRE